MLRSISGNNITVALINLLGGFSLGIISLLNTFYNGEVLGLAVSVAITDFPVADLLRQNPKLLKEAFSEP